MLVLASFNYTLSPVAAVMGLVVALLSGWAWVRGGRPRLSAVCGGLCWGGLGGLVAMAGEGDMRQLTSILFGVGGFALGIVVIGGLTALLGPRDRKKLAPATTEPPHTR
jgi:hypothetical protein